MASREQVGELYYKITADEAEYLRSIKRVEEETASTLTRTSLKLDEYKAQWAELGRFLQLHVALPTTIALGVASKMATGAEATERRFRAMFRSMSEEAELWGSDIGRRLGYGVSSVMDIMSRYQMLFTPLGFAQERAFELSKTLTQLTVDLAAFYRASPRQVADSLSMTLLGSSRAGYQLGIVLRDDQIEARLVNRGLKDLTGTAKEQAMVQERLNEILKQTAIAQGAAMANAESHSETMRRMTEVLHELGETFGKDLNEKLDQFINRYALPAGQRLLWMDDSTRKLILDLGVLTALISGLIGAMGTLAKLRNLVLSTFGGGLAGLGVPKQLAGELGGWGTIALVIGAIFLSVMKYSDNLRQEAERTEKALSAMWEAASGGARKQWPGEAEKQIKLYSRYIENWRKDLEEIEKDLKSAQEEANKAALVPPEAAATLGTFGAGNAWADQYKRASESVSIQQQKDYQIASGRVRDLAEQKASLETNIARMEKRIEESRAEDEARQAENKRKLDEEASARWVAGSKTREELTKRLQAEMLQGYKRELFALDQEFEAHRKIMDFEDGEGRKQESALLRRWYAARRTRIEEEQLAKWHEQATRELEKERTVRESFYVIMRGLEGRRAGGPAGEEAYRKLAEIEVNYRKQLQTVKESIPAAEQLAAVDILRRQTHQQIKDLLDEQVKKTRELAEAAERLTFREIRPEDWGKMVQEVVYRNWDWAQRGLGESLVQFKGKRITGVAEGAETVGVAPGAEEKQTLQQLLEAVREQTRVIEDRLSVWD